MNMDNYPSLDEMKADDTSNSDPILYFKVKGNFTRAEKYMGSFTDEGYIFKNGKMGLGYYKDSTLTKSNFEKLSRRPRSKEEKEKYAQELRDRVLKNKKVHKEEELKEKRTAFKKTTIQKIKELYDMIENQIEQKKYHTPMHIFKFGDDGLHTAIMKFVECLKIIKELNNSGMFMLDINYVNGNGIAVNETDAGTMNNHDIGVYFNWGESKPNFIK